MVRFENVTIEGFEAALERSMGRRETKRSPVATVLG